MRFFYLILILVISYTVQAQTAACCTPTKAFADLGAQTDFQDEHQLPAFTQTDEVSGKWISFATPDSAEGRAYFVKSKTVSQKYLFVFHEWWGLNSNIINEADKWATVFPDVNILALDLYDGKVGSTREAAAELMQSASEERIRAIISGAIEFSGDEAKVATIGWCFGGGWSMQATLQLEEQALGCVVYYGMLEKDSEKIASLNCKVLGIFAEKDQWINRKVVAEYEKAMDENKKAYETFWFDAEHAFANPSNAIFNETAATKANAISKSFLIKAFE